LLLGVLVENQSGVPMDLPALKGLAEYVLNQEGAGEEAEISVALVDLESMRGLNLRFRKLDQPTDVLAFDLGDEGELYGEVVIAPEVAAEQAREAGVAEAEEMQALLVHGMLHLLGYSHDTQAGAAKMFERQERLRRDFTHGGAA
jgi:probable rRNA maturation factor